MHGASQEVGFSSNPSNARVFVDGVPVGRTPLNTKLSRNDNHIVKIELDGYMPYEATLTRSVSGWVWGNLVFGGLVGLVVDAVSGGIYKLTPDQIQGELREDVASGYSDGSLYLAVAFGHEQGWEQIGALQHN